MLKRKNKISPQFSMSSMTDIIFLLLIFFMITSTMVSPNAIKVLLPQSSQQTSAKPLTRVIIDRDLNYYTAFGNEDEMPILFLLGSLIHNGVQDFQLIFWQVIPAGSFHLPPETLIGLCNQIHRSPKYS